MKTHEPIATHRRTRRGKYWGVEAKTLPKRAAQMRIFAVPVSNRLTRTKREV
jgi:hypothetical protein